MELLALLFETQTKMLEQLSKVRLKFDYDDHSVKLTLDNDEMAGQLYKTINSWLNIQVDIKKLELRKDLAKKRVQGHATITVDLTDVEEADNGDTTHYGGQMIVDFGDRKKTYQCKGCDRDSHSVFDEAAKDINEHFKKEYDIKEFELEFPLSYYIGNDIVINHDGIIDKS